MNQTHAMKEVLDTIQAIKIHAGRGNLDCINILENPYFIPSLDNVPECIKSDILKARSSNGKT